MCLVISNVSGNTKTFLSENKILDSRLLNEFVCFQYEF